MRNFFKINSFSLGLLQFIVAITFLFFIPTVSYAQRTDTLTTNNEKLATNNKPTKLHSPRKATICSAILPGLGQVYNKKYWKVPIIYAAAGALVYSFDYNQSRYVKYRDALKYRIENNLLTTDDIYGRYSNENLDELQKSYHRYRDLTVIGFAALYILNIVDATVDAHLFHFDVNDDLSLNIQPTLINTTTSLNSYTTGLSLNIKF